MGSSADMTSEETASEPEDGSGEITQTEKNNTEHPRSEDINSVIDDVDSNLQFQPQNMEEEWGTGKIFKR